MIDYVAVASRLKQELQDAKVVRRMLNDFARLAIVIARVKVSKRQGLKGHGKKENKRKELVILQNSNYTVIY